jgi:hypothetical protein
MRHNNGVYPLVQTKRKILHITLLLSLSARCTRKEFTDHALLLLLTSELTQRRGRDLLSHRQSRHTSSANLGFRTPIVWLCSATPKKLGDGRPRRPDFQSWQLHSPVSHASDVLEAFPFCSSFNSYWAR